MKVHYQVEGVEETIRALKRLDSDRDTRAIILAAMRKGAKPIVDEARNQMNNLVSILRDSDGEAVGFKKRADIEELKRSITKRVGRSKNFPTLIVGFKKPKARGKKGFQWYQRLVEMGTDSSKRPGDILPGWSFYKAHKMKSKEATRKTLEAIKEKFNARARRMGFKQI